MVMVKKSKCLFIGDEADVKFCVMLVVFFFFLVGRFGIEVSFCYYVECRLRAR